MQKLIAVIEVFYLSLMFLLNGLWQVVFNNRRADWQITTKPFKRKKKPALPFKNAVEYYENLYKKEVQKNV